MTSPPTVVVFDYGSGNVHSAVRALERVGAEVSLTGDPKAALAADGLFVPGVAKDASIAKICGSASLPVNVMVMDGVPPKPRLAELGVSRISYGPIPYVRAMSALQQGAKAAFA